MKKRVRYTVDDVANNRFYQMPKFLFEGEFKNGLSNDAKVLYSLLRDRHDLSLTNNWINEKNEVYLIYTREKMSDMLGVSQPTLRKAIKQLEDFGLMEEDRMGLNKANRIYLTAITVENSGLKESFSPECKNLSVQSERIFQSRVKESFSQECKNLSPNDTDFNDTDFNDTDISQSVSQEKQEKTDRQTDIDEIKTIFEKQLSLKDLRYSYKYDSELINEIELNILEMYFNSYTIIQGEKKSQAIVRSALYRLDYCHIEMILMKFKNLTTKVINLKSYIQTMIYNTAFENKMTITNDLKSNGII
ncbi:MAG: replication initiator protein A [Marinisporobacter sp.]|nr:replication initiator protein A [Marinisporobacter sp.]